MKLHKARLFFAGLAVLLVPTRVSIALALDVPPLRGRVNDLAGMLPSDRAQLLEDRLATFEKETGHQIALLTIPSLKGDVLEDFSIRVAESWKIGQKGFDNGAILLIAQKERKLRIEVGYGLEGVLPDAIANRIIQETIIPIFRQSDYNGGIEAGINMIMQVTRGEGLPNYSAGNRSDSEINTLWVSFAFLSILILPRTVMWRWVLPLSREHGALIGGAVGAVVGGLTSAASIILGVHVSLFGIMLLFLLAILIGIVSGLQGYLRASQRFGNRRDIRWNEPFYISGDGFSMASLRQRSGGVGIGGSSVGGSSAAGFTGGGGGFGGGGASGGW